MAKQHSPGGSGSSINSYSGLQQEIARDANTPDRAPGTFTSRGGDFSDDFVPVLAAGFERNRSVEHRAAGQLASRAMAAAAMELRQDMESKLIDQRPTTNDQRR